MLCVGLTGGIGCGKSTVAEMFAEFGATVIDTDAISHTLTQPGAAGFNEILRQFGNDFRRADGTLDRAKLRTLVFSDPSAKARLEGILHPLIREQVVSAIDACKGPYAVIVVPLLFETGNYLPLVQRTLVVDCDEAAQIARTVTRSGLSEAEVRAIMANQVSRQARLSRADDVITNNAGPEVLREQVLALHHRYLSPNLETHAKP